MCIPVVLVLLRSKPCRIAPTTSYRCLFVSVSESSAGRCQAAVPDDASRGSGADPATAAAGPGSGAMHRHGFSFSVRSAALFAASLTGRRSGRGVVAVGRPAGLPGRSPSQIFLRFQLASRGSTGERGVSWASWPRPAPGVRRRRVPPATGHPWLRATPCMCASARRS